MTTYELLNKVRDHTNAVITICRACDVEPTERTAAAALECFLKIYPDSPLNKLTELQSK